ncbi:Cell death abnormality protein [Trichinella spiralis]|uniref:Cell death abnormality protein n=1 Tax=Trichinella spiralis TaxID=6334 RepID=A0ABR3K0Q8_TRISP
MHIQQSRETDRKIEYDNSRDGQSTTTVGRNRTKRIKPENDESSVVVVTTGPTGPDDRTMNAGVRSTQILNDQVRWKEKKYEKKGGGFSGSEKKTIISATFPPVCPNSIGPLSSSSTFVGWSSNVQSADTVSSVKKMNEMTNDDNIIIQVKSQKSGQKKHKMRGVKERRWKRSRQASKQASKQAGRQWSRYMEKEDKLLARRARSNQKTEDIRRRSSSCAETFSSSLPANFAKQAR